MENSISEQNPGHTISKVEAELAEMRESVRQGTYQAETSLVVPAEEVFRELRQRNVAEAKRSRK